MMVMIFSILFQSAVTVILVLLLYFNNFTHGVNISTTPNNSGREYTTPLPQTTPIKINDTYRIAKDYNVNPSTEKQLGTIIFLHGLGDTGYDWGLKFSKFREPHMKTICPTGNLINLTFTDVIEAEAWYDMRYLDPHLKEDFGGLKRASHFVQSLINAEIQSGIPPDRIIVGGYDQGGALALFSAFTFPQKLGGVVVLQGWLPTQGNFTNYVDPASKNTPVFQCHRDRDTAIPYGMALFCASELRKISHSVNFVTLEGRHHTVADEELKEMVEFIKRRVPKI